MNACAPTRALAQWVAGASGQNALDAYVAGLEACALIGDGIGLAHYERGWRTSRTMASRGRRSGRGYYAWIAASMSISTRMRGLAKPSTMRPVLTGYTPFR